MSRGKRSDSEKSIRVRAERASKRDNQQLGIFGGGSELYNTRPRCFIARELYQPTVAYIYEGVTEDVSAETSASRLRTHRKSKGWGQPTPSLSERERKSEGVENPDAASLCVRVCVSSRRESGSKRRHAAAVAAMRIFEGSTTTTEQHTYTPDVPGARATERERGGMNFLTE